MLTPARVSSPFALVLVLVVSATLTLWFHSPWFPLATLAAGQDASGGWISVTLVGSAVLGAAELSLVLTLGKQRLCDLGWLRNRLVPALVVTALLWATMQASTVLAAHVQGTTLQWRGAWGTGLGVALGPLLAQVLGTALFEETLFRAWLWPQFNARMPETKARWVAPALGLVASQAVFALMHVPGRMYAGASASELGSMLLMLFVAGIVFALVYFATRNLFIAIGAHALGNAPTLLFEPQGPAPTLVLLGAVLVVSIVMWVWRTRSDVADKRASAVAASA